MGEQELFNQKQKEKKQNQNDNNNDHNNNKWKKGKEKRKKYQKARKIILVAMILMISWLCKTVKVRNKSKAEHVEKNK